MYRSFISNVSLIYVSWQAMLTIEMKLPGPSLVVCPLSVLATWLAEFKRWAPAMRIVRLHSADREERELLRKETLADVSSYDVVG